MSLIDHEPPLGYATYFEYEQDFDSSHLTHHQVIVPDIFTGRLLLPAPDNPNIVAGDYLVKATECRAVGGKLLSWFGLPLVRLTLIDFSDGPPLPSFEEEVHYMNKDGWLTQRQSLISKKITGYLMYNMVYGSYGEGLAARCKPLLPDVSD